MVVAGFLLGCEILRVTWIAARGHFGSMVLGFHRGDLDESDCTSDDSGSYELEKIADVYDWRRFRHLATGA